MEQITLHLSEQVTAELRRLSRREGHTDLTAFVDHLIREHLEAARVKALNAREHSELREHTYRARGQPPPSEVAYERPLQPIRVPARWRVEHNSFSEVDPDATPEADWHLSPDLLYATNDRAALAIDLGWRGTVELGAFCLQMLAFADGVPDWENPRREFRSRIRAEIMQALEEWLACL